MSRQKYSSEFKQQVLQEVQDTHNATIVARRHQLSPSMVRRWTREARQDAGESQGVSGLIEENTQLKRLVIERDLPMVVLQDALRKKGAPL